MRPSGSAVLELELERGVPWGCDLFTFVTSAAGHMMRTLQKPRKKRPSKRRVNHRRFLHNMIQRKFAEIEAQNHRLASVLFSMEDVNKLPSSPPQEPVTPDQSDSTSKDISLHDAAETTISDTLTEMSTVSKSGLSPRLHKAEVCERTQPASGHLCKPNAISHMDQSDSRTSRINSQDEGANQQTLEIGVNHSLVEIISQSSSEQTDFYHKGELSLTRCISDESPVKASDNLAEDYGLCSWIESVKEIHATQFNHHSKPKIIHCSQSLDSSTAIDPPFTPELSPLPLDFCDFAIQMFPDVSACTQTKNNRADTAESRQQVDVMDLLESDIDDGDVEGCVDVEAYFESIWEDCQGDAWGLGGNAHADDITFLDQPGKLMEKMRIHSSESNCRSEVEHLDCGKEVYGYGHEYRFSEEYRCSEDQGSTIDNFMSDQRILEGMVVNESRKARETEATCFKSSQGVDVFPNQLSTSTSYHYDSNTCQCPQQETSLMLNSGGNQNCTPFEGVAQSFSAPALNPQHHPILTLPLEDDWLFTDILQDRMSPQY